MWDCVRIEQKMLRRFRGADQRRDYLAEEDVRTSVTLAQGSEPDNSLNILFFFKQAFPKEYFIAQGLLFYSAEDIILSYVKFLIL